MTNDDLKTRLIERQSKIGEVLHRLTGDGQLDPAIINLNPSFDDELDFLTLTLTPVPYPQTPTPTDKDKSLDAAREFLAGLGAEKIDAALADLKKRIDAEAKKEKDAAEKSAEAAKALAAEKAKQATQNAGADRVIHTPAGQ